MSNKGDTLEVLLDFTVDGIPLEEYGADEIEFCMGQYRYTLSGGDIELDPQSGKYSVLINQEQTFNMDYITAYQVRVLKNDRVGSLDIQKIPLGDTLSTTVLAVAENEAVTDK